MSDPFQPLKPSRENNGASFQHSMQPHFGLQGHVLIPSTADIPEIAPHYRNQYMPETFSNSNTNDFNEMLTEEIQQQKGMERQDHKVKLGYRRAGVACDHCRRRKIRCIWSESDRQGVCVNCTRSKRHCEFSVKQQTRDNKSLPNQFLQTSMRDYESLTNGVLTASSLPTSLWGPAGNSATGTSESEEYCVPGYGPEDFTEWTSREASLSPYSQAGQSASSWQLSPYTPTPGENPVILPLEPVLPYVPASMLPTYTSNFEEWDSPCPTSSAPCSEEYYH
ncbi:hypothetical protein CEK26_001848 [Fusarium fujikuroi]|uniref:Uncharacterized protein n=1 Tax=Fusarium fujikuroi TaxID=5127 RepID=A0A5Q3D059_FUSFU|nr:hypothetical protein CEK27_001843 [Fusarium fujikuroi]QGI76920.1 hypothetical protein CEK25_001826 [Fusarium fujikuroi]QGI90633.1 hypothetical protein CEK26_001848 [Fusarium fujikuroi]VTT72370.1 unnamed protein product [Fusarium fujikuroi]VTT77249.1 unnamed protein product [Fusarium fujikuroi]